MSDSALQDKVIVIIGGTTGLGLSAACAVLAAGARGVVITGRNQESASAATAALGELAAAVTGDATSPDHADQAIAAAVSRFGGFDGLYHVAGGSGRRMGDGPLHEITDEAVPATLALNLHSVIYSNRAAVRQFLTQQTGGSILNMGSVLGWSPSPEYFSTHIYAAAKSAITGFTQSIAACDAPQGIRAKTPISPRSGPAQRLFQEPPAKGEYLAILVARWDTSKSATSGRFPRMTVGGCGPRYRA